MADLNAHQKSAVHYIDGPLLVLAGAGSGKTRAITRKIAYLIQECGLAPHQITAVTFTNKAAREMKARVGELLNSEQTKGLKISTFHTLGLNILRREHALTGLTSGFTILDAQDAEALLKELCKKSHSDEISEVRAAQWCISSWKNNLLSPQQALSQAKDEQVAETARLYADYQRTLQAYNAVDFDDLILRPVQLLLSEPEVLERWQNRIRHMLVDEYQDTNLCQYELIKQLVGVRGALTVVGDDDQSIYAWRGARPENMAQLKKDFPRLKVIKLEQNYRSSGRILRSANQLISHNPHLFDKALWSELGPGDPIRILVCKNEVHEAEQVAMEILHHRIGKRTKFSDYAILYRGNHQARLFEKSLRENNIPYFISGGTSFFARTEIKDVMAYLRLLANPDDNAAFLRIINTPRREIGASTLEKLADYARQRNENLLNTCNAFGLEEHLSSRPRERLQQFSHWFQQIQQRAESDDPIGVIRTLLQDIDYRGWIDDNSANRESAKRRWDNVEELIIWLNNLHKGELQEKTLAEMVNHLTLMDVLERQNEEESSDQVTLMTLHGAKGLEFPHVYLVGVEEELLPHHSSIDEDNIEEERRLAYVGITRAQRSLTISYASKRKRFGELIRCEPSRFLKELPEEDLEWSGRKSKLTEEEQQKRGSACLNSLKALLAEE